MTDRDHSTCSREIIRLGTAHAAQARDILPKAFSDDPMFRHLFPGAKRSVHIGHFFSFLFHKSLLLQEMLIGVQEQGTLRGAACVELPTSYKDAGFLAKARFLCRAIGLLCQVPPRSFALINEYMRLTTSVRPSVPHHYLVFVGVDPEHQGTGLGKLLLNEIHALADADPTSAGIGLDTENEDNVLLYERFGYRLVEKRKLGAVTIYCMFRPRP
ncbi:hypothetical protein AV654_34450 [Paenibacillus elgii]|uniref:N-acetyltransferase domain-containing protein n=1 Tax=Paenibacillus elgii TaxID=189691 RepID=A0A163TN90_9BACL|nr:GNAT family N-acetyltransferase [Paenibacillus elgii]KZE72110.1 hypothetical protein AV654_34450 [Paenibacillus elgii]